MAYTTSIESSVQPYAKVPVPATPRTNRRKNLDGKHLVMRRHPAWSEHQIGWRWMLDSFEGGQRYRNAVYGPDRKGLPTRNLFRHRREYPNPQEYPNIYQGFAGFLGSVNAHTVDIGMGPYPGMSGAAPQATAQDDDYELRRSRTPVPTWTSDMIGIHLGKVYDQKPTRKGPDLIEQWWKGVDGRGLPIDDWMQDVIAPLLLCLGCIDVCFDHPRAPEGVEIISKADERRYGLDRCIASYILPENMLWWKVDAAGRYVECLVREYVDPSDRNDFDKHGNPIDPESESPTSESWRKQYLRYRYWDHEESVLLNWDGSKTIERIDHPYGTVPIVRLIDQPKHRTPQIGKSRYEGIAELQREYYNRDSELILSDTLQAHPFLSGPEDYCKGDNTISVGPGYVLPKKFISQSNTYEGWVFVSPPKDPAQSIRLNKQDIHDAMMIAGYMSKPAGTVGSGVTTASQSGYSKELDQVSGNKLLSSVAKSLAKAERFLAEYAALVSTNGQLTPEIRAAIEVTYATRFELHSAQDMALWLQQFQANCAMAGSVPEIEFHVLSSQYRKQQPGLSAKEYERADAAIIAMLEVQAKVKAALNEQMGVTGVSSKAEALEGTGSRMQRAQTDPTGTSGGTMVANITPSVI